MQQDTLQQIPLREDHFLAGKLLAFSPVFRLWSIEPYNRCSFRCSYCCSDAQGKASPAVSRDELVTELEKELAAAIASGQFDPDNTEIILSCYCDPYVPEEHNQQITRAIITFLAQKKLRFALVTRSDMVERDIDLLAPLQGLASVSMSLPILDPACLDLYEEFTPSPAKRLRALAALTQAGVRTTVRIDPWIPGVTSVMDILARLPAACEVLVSPLHLQQTLSAFMQEKNLTILPPGNSFLASKLADITRHGASRSTSKLFANLTQEQINRAYINERNRIGFRKRTRWLYPVTAQSPPRDFYRFLKPDELQA